MLASTSSSRPRPRKWSPALEAMLSNFEAPEDLLSGSESSSLVASPIEENSTFTFEPQSPAFQHQDNRKLVQLESAPQQPIELVLDFLEYMGDTDATERFFSSSTIIEYCGHAMSIDQKSSTHQRNLNNLRAKCSAHDLQIDSVFSQGGDVAAFGHFDYSVCPIGLHQIVQFSFWAEVDVERARIVRFRWLDQIVRGEDPRVDG